MKYSPFLTGGTLGIALINLPLQELPLRRALVHHLEIEEWNRLSMEVT